MEPDVIRMYSSSPPPLDDGAEEDDSEFGDFGTFCSVPNSISFTQFDTPTTFNQSQALTATSPPELLSSRGVGGFSASNGTHRPSNEVSKANGVALEKHPGSAPSERTELKKVFTTSVDICAGDTGVVQPPGCNGGGGGAEVLTNGFAPPHVQGSASLRDSVPLHLTASTEDAEDDFAAFSNAEGQFRQTASEGLDTPTGCSWLGGDHTIAQGTTSEDTSRTGPAASSSGPPSGSVQPPDGSCNTDRGPHLHAGSQQRDATVAQKGLASEELEPASLNGADVAEGGGCSDVDMSLDADGSDVGQSDEKGSGNETETETSLGRVLSTDALEEYGDMSTTGSVPSPSLLGENALPADNAQLAEDDEDFGYYGDASGQNLTDFDHPGVQNTWTQEAANHNDSRDWNPPKVQSDPDDSRDWNPPKVQSDPDDSRDGGQVVEFPPSDSFGNFSSAAEGVDGEVNEGWSAFGEQQVEEESWAAFSTEQTVAPPTEKEEQQQQQQEEQEEEESWAAFSTEQTVAPPPAAPPTEDREEQQQEEEQHGGGLPGVSEETSRTDRQPVSLSSRLEKLFQTSFPQTAVPSAGDQVTSLEVLLGTPGDRPPPGDEEAVPPPRGCGRSVWTQLQDVNEAVGLRYQWGGSHCNKTLLCCLGIDTRNILFTGQKKQPVIVPMYAASLGMLEPTKEPVKPISAAEMIASIGQAPPVDPDGGSCPSDSVQEVLPPVQFDWSSSGLTNPLDASGGSALLNLDFFGPVEDSGSTSSASIPGVDPELFELTTSKLDSGGAGSRVADAFARLMSTMEKTSTSTRKLRKEENLSEEAVQVIAGLPDLSFMQAKVLMFPATLTPIGCQASPD